MGRYSSVPLFSLRRSGCQDCVLSVPLSLRLVIFSRVTFAAEEPWVILWTFERSLFLNRIMHYPFPNSLGPPIASEIPCDVPVTIYSSPETAYPRGPGWRSS